MFFCPVSINDASVSWAVPVAHCWLSQRPFLQNSVQNSLLLRRLSWYRLFVLRILCVFPEHPRWFITLHYNIFLFFGIGTLSIQDRKWREGAVTGNSAGYLHSFPLPPWWKFFLLLPTLRTPSPSLLITQSTLLPLLLRPVLAGRKHYTSSSKMNMSDSNLGW